MCSSKLIRQGGATDKQLADWHARTLAIEAAIGDVIVGQDSGIRLICIATFSRGNVLIEGNVGVGGPVSARIPHLNDRGEIVGYWRHDEVMQIDVHSLGRPGTETGETTIGINMANVARRIALGQEHLSSLREDHLKQLATGAGLDYQRVESHAAFANSLLTEKYARATRVLTDLGWIPAMLAFACLAYPLLIRPWHLRTLHAKRLSVNPV